MTGVPVEAAWPLLVPRFGVIAAPLGLLIPLVIWALVLKGLALWRAARAGQWIWFVVLLFVNTAGLLEIVYLLFFAGQADATRSPAGPPESPAGSGPPVVRSETAGADERGAHARP